MAHLLRSELVLIEKWGSHPLGPQSTDLLNLSAPGEGVGAGAWESAFS